ncbi:MAG: phosphatidylserine decarboxylase [Saprospiraceae bacterium]|jgi:phosphatidylserine decarboxylase
MTIHKEGYPSIAIVIIFDALIILLVKYFAPEILWLHCVVYTLASLLFLIILQFFRNPSRDFKQFPDQVIAPCDGKVVVIEKVHEPEYFKDERIQVSIFMSPINVHINRNPISGIFKYVKYHPGKYLMAFNPKSSTENERTSIVIENEKGTSVLFRQIAGFLARRIVYYCKEGDKATQVDQFGFIKFGSRVDLFFPLDTEITATIGDTVKGGVSKIAKLAS